MFQDTVFDLLGSDLTGEVLSFLHPLDLLFPIGMVCKSWRNIATRNLLICDLKSFDEFFITKKGRSYVRMWIRTIMYDVAQQFQIHSRILMNHTRITSHIKGMENYLDTITFYMSHFHDLTNPKKKQVQIIRYESNDAATTTHNEPEGNTSLLDQIFSVFNIFIGNSTTTPPTVTQPTLPSNDIQIKCIMDGNYSVGKTHFTQCIMLDKVLTQTSMATVGMDFKQRTFVVEKDNNVEIQLWDTGSQERIHELPVVYFRSCGVVFLMFDLTNRKTFLELKDKSSVKMFLEDEMSQFEIVLIGNKVDVVESGRKKREVSREEALEFANRVLDGALYVESTNTNLKVPSSLGWYVVIHQLVMKKVKPSPVVKMVKIKHNQ